MDNDTIEANEHYTPPIYYTLVTALVAFSLVAILIYLGVQGYPFWPVVLLGGLAQVFFRVIKRAWLNALNAEHQTDGSAEVDEGISQRALVRHRLFVLVAFLQAI